MKPVHIVIFAKAPQPGKVKTRLIPLLGAEMAAHMAHRMLQYTLEQALLARIGPVELCASPAVTENTWRAVKLPTEVLVSEQGEGDLGQRLSRATLRHVQAGAAVLLIGTDCPYLDADTLRQAAQTLIHHDALMIPAFDGGYVLLGLERHHPSLFEDIAWGTSSVAYETKARLHSLGMNLVTLPFRYDIDEPADLCHLPKPWKDIYVHTDESFCKKNG
ncbi:MAG: glycosyltransferase [Pseudomonadales bacterium]|nr:glycosyltransferase [Pseudomonadales bacterium]